MKVLTHSNEKLMSLALLVLRIGIGSIMFAHGAQKVFGAFGGKGLEETVTGMSKMLDIPVALAYLSAFTELLGGLALLLGIFTRFFGIAVLINMLVAVFAVHFKNGFFAPTGFEYPGLLALIALVITIAGPGLYSLDQAIFARRVAESEYRKTVTRTGTLLASNGTILPKSGTTHLSRV